MKRKGISPLIAAVLLIAFTMAVASIFAQWAPQLIEDAQGETSEDAKDIQRCSNVILDISSGDATQATVQQTQGDKAVGNFTVTWFYEDAEPVQESTELTDSNRNITQISNGEDSSYGELIRIEAEPTDCTGAALEEYEP